MAIRLGLESFAPFTLCAIRFFLAGFPLVLFYRFPPVPWPRLLLYSLFIGVLQYGLMFWAIHLKLPAGMSSVLIQTQVYITIFFAWIVFRERVSALQITGFAISAIGLFIIGSDYFGGAQAAGFLLILLSALFWSAGNILLKTFRIEDFAGFIAWTSLLSSLPLFALAVGTEGYNRIVHDLQNASLRSWLAILFMSLFATQLAFSLFSKMMLKLPAGKVMPFGTLVPVFGLSSNAIFLGERFPGNVFIGAALVFAGLIVAVVLSAILSISKRSSALTR